MKQLLDRKTANEIVKEIHNAIDSAQDRLLQEAKDMIANNTPKETQKAVLMESIGFVNSQTVIAFRKNQEFLVKNTEQAKLIEYYKQTYPFQKFLTEEELNRICKKYKLIYKPVENYTRDVPEKNLIEISSAKARLKEDAPSDTLWCELKKDNSFYLVHGNGDDWCGLWGSNWWRIPKKIKGHNFRSEHAASQYLREAFGFNTHYLIKEVINFKQDRQGLFIAAPPSHFKGKDLSISFVKIEDPIVFRFVKGGVQVLSKWGLEAEDPSLLNEKLN